MRVTNLKIVNFRNIASADVSFGPSMNLVLGANGQGKTNLVEAITFLSWLKSFRTSRTADIVRHGHDDAFLLASVEGATSRRGLEVSIGRGFRRATMDGNPVRSARDCLDEFTVAFLSPDDPAILEGGPGGRRAMIDRFTVLLDPGLLPLFKNYAQLLRQRNEILRAPSGEWDDGVLDACEEAAASAGAKVVAARKAALDQLLGHLPKVLADMAGKGLEARVTYVSRWLPPDCGDGEVGPLLREKLASRRQADAAVGRTTAGPHSDDLGVDLEGHSARGHASRGQKKILMLAWKAAEVKVFGLRDGRVPVLVLDDAMADLDPERQALVAGYLEAYPGQSFLTGTSAPPSIETECAVFHADTGSFTPGEAPRDNLT